MGFIDFLAPQNVLARLKAPNKEAVLRALAEHASPACALQAETLFQAMLRREKLGSTGVGAGIAIPHAKLDIAKPVGVFARLDRPIDFDAIDKKPVDLVFLLLSPDSEISNLAPLASVTRVLRDPEKAKKLRAAPDANALFVLLTHHAARD